MEIETTIKYLKISPKKLRLIAGEIKQVKPVDALNILLYSQKRGAKILLNAIKSAINNAKNNYKMDENLLMFKLLLIEGGPFLKRFRAGGRGNAKPFKRRTSHIKVVLITESGKTVDQDVKSKQDIPNRGKGELKITQDSK